MTNRRTFLSTAAKLLLMLSPLVLATVVYIVRDPFRVLYKYEFENYYDQFAPVELNRDYVSFEMFRQNYSNKHYDSFMFGSSRSFPFHCDVWKQHLHKATPFHYPAASENLLGIAEKLRYLDEQGITLANVLMELYFVGPEDLTLRTDVTHRLPYAISGESWLDFQGAMLSSYFSDFYFVKYVDYTLTGRVHTYAADALAIKPGQVRIDPETNDYFFEAYERELSENEENFYFARSGQFPAQTGTPLCAAPLLGPAHGEKLRFIRRIFDKHHTDARLVIPPIYDRICLNPEDLRLLRDTLGDSVVFDFTGVNGFTTDMHNFYDAGHVRPHVAEKVLAAMYAPSR